MFVEIGYPDGYFDAVYSYMLFNMRFSEDELHFIFSEIRVLKLKGLNFFSVRNHNDKSYGKGRKIDKGIYDINGFPHDYNAIGVRTSFGLAIDPVTGYLWDTETGGQIGYDEINLVTPKFIY